MPRKLIPMNKDAGDANLPVYLGLTGGISDHRTVEPLVNLLRSDHDIQPAIRDILADALEGHNTELKLVLSRRKSGPAPPTLPLVKALRELG